MFLSNFASIFYAISQLLRDEENALDKKIEKKLTEVKEQLKRNETGSALILLDQVLEMCLRDECLKYGVTPESKIGEKEFSSWGVPEYLRFLDSRSLLTKEQKSYFFKVHDWRNKAQHSGLEPKRELVEEALKKIASFVKGGVICARVIMNKPVVGVDSNDQLSKAVALMKKHDYSQLPVFEWGEPVGSISEKSFLDFFQKNGKPPRPDLLIKEIMDKSFPLVREDAPLTEILKRLQSSHGILVTKDDHVIGIITKADLLKLI